MPPTAKAVSPPSGRRPKKAAVADALTAAEAICRARGIQFTSLRRAILQLLVEAQQPLGAYDIIERLEEVLGRRISPPTVYRVLDFLLEQKLLTRIESRNAFVPCAHPDHAHTCIFFICRSCGTSTEIENPILEGLFDQAAAGLGFQVDRRVVEIEGRCAACVAAGRV
ncbi:Fur family transcriptional regulator [Ancylobacter mangrovi]|uniref:Fur family transcriptional regulator n=1 Tax=Ancylobacter mangrovi TaxID=2972472 RepID=UPI002162519A|nr:Fur family transcriptional regulator [Ancylobacter mangrovi]MCS0504772.1 transcriptional repressor [Ancylobacter mangrovi]